MSVPGDWVVTMTTMGGWTARRIVGFDTETTGVDVRTDRIVTAAVVIRAGITGLAQVRTWLIDPGVEIPEAASAIHGVTTAHARAHGVAPAGALEEIAALLAAALNEQCPVVAYNACFDLTLLEYELARHGLATLSDRLGRAPAPAIDPLVLDRALDRYRPGKRRLADLAEYYGVVASGDLHAADVDVDATLDVLAALVRRFPELGELGVDALHDRQIRAHYRWASSFNDWLVANGFDREPADLAWPLGGQYAPPADVLRRTVEGARRAAVRRPVARESTAS